MKRDQTISEYYQSPIFDTISGLENAVQDINRLAHGLMLLSAGMNGPEWLPVWTMAKIIKDRAVEVEEARVEIFDLTHPAVKEWKDKGGLEAYRNSLKSKAA